MPEQQPPRPAASEREERVSGPPVQHAYVSPGVTFIPVEEPVPPCPYPCTPCVEKGRQ
ncbi:hypothetical protein HEK616_01690 [Streptomyces nigrescens]|uniref:Uncharacterized protein n=1 Tax=Streptomyces nigrescens TaxID=1920 RepID=A0ABM7ZK33_STRNI|nr:hypothetical protein HEK616_01690 [Streptomyces nigrescens]